MTAELGILNKSAVALAADSAVTITNRKGEKIYNSANKLFSLSKCHPIGIMVYGSAELSGVPWETIIKIYRNELDNRSFETVKEYAEDFFHFLQENENYIFPDNVVTSGLEKVVFQFLTLQRDKLEYNLQLAFEGSDDEYETFVEEEEDIDPEKVINVLKSNVKVNLSEFAESEYLPHFDIDDVQKIIESQEEMITKVIKFLFKNLPVDEEIMGDLITMVAYYLCKDVFTNQFSGIVVAGFGELETFPSLFSYIVECKVGNKLKYKNEDTKNATISNDVEGFVIPFAQDDMVYTILSGVDQEYDEFSKTFLSQAFKDYPLELLNHIKTVLQIDPEKADELEELFNKTSFELFKNYIQETEKYLYMHHVYPILNTIEILPKEELASIAETLVNLTSFKRKISADSETVGGPVDVALITKGDGFVWIKRKHYFDANLNRQFFNNY